mmetsp:Transcript_111029/g.358152  ORF Transcript_111029/g.358152 Transcript_111029/m.358152 type:complete len:105 (-) Transcript_111029:283-597(-)
MERAWCRSGWSVASSACWESARSSLLVLQLPSCLHLLLDGSECALFHGIALSLTGSTFAGMGLFLASVITILRRTEEMVKAEVVYQARFQRPRTRPEFVDAFTF